MASPTAAARTAPHRSETSNGTPRFLARSAEVYAPMHMNAECPMLSWPQVSDGRRLAERMILVSTRTTIRAAAVPALRGMAEESGRAEEQQQDDEDEAQEKRRLGAERGRNDGIDEAQDEPSQDGSRD